MLAIEIAQVLANLLFFINFTGSRGAFSDFLLAGLASKIQEEVCYVPNSAEILISRPLHEHWILAPRSPPPEFFPSDIADGTGGN